MFIEGLLAHDGNSLIGRKVILVILQHGDVEDIQEAVRGAARHQIHLLAKEGAIEQAEIHEARRPTESEPIGLHEATVAVRTLHELVAKPWPPADRIRNRL